MGSFTSRDKCAAHPYCRHDPAVHVRRNRKTLRNSATVVERRHRHASEAGLKAAFTAFADARFRCGIASGFAQEDAVALIKVLQAASLSSPQVAVTP